MKKYLFGALALPLLFACSSEDFDEKVVSNDQFAGIAKVEATFSMDEGATTRFDGKNGVATWNPQEGDLWGFAWMGGTPSPITINGQAYQNHNLIQKGNYFEPQTSIYVGNYYIYRPYDETTVNVGKINFNSLVDQPLAEGYESAKQPWKDLAKTAINIGDKWTTVTTTGWTDLGGTTWDKAGIKQNYKLYAAIFSNQTGLDLTYQKNNPTFAAAKRVQGATDIDYTFAAGTEVGAADIYEATVDLTGQAKSFTYAPTVEPNTAAHNNTFWASKSNLAAVTAGTPGDGFAFTAGAITLTPADAVNGLTTGDNGSKAWFWFNSLPVTAGNATLTTNVTTIFDTSYGVVTVTKQLKDVASVFEQYTPGTGSPEWIKLVNTGADNATTTPKEWNFASHNTFINQYGNHKGKYALTVDFSKGVMNGMDIRNDAHLQKLLKYYIASGKNNEPNVVLNLLPASATDNTFKISKMSIALLQTINRGTNKVYVDASTYTLDKVIVTQDGQGDLDLADKKEVPELNNVFNSPTDVALSKDCEWTWKERTGANQLTIDGNVNSLTNEGTLTVNATNIELSPAPALPLANAAGATMNITKLTTVKTALTNLGTINVGAADNTAAELRAYNVAITNDAKELLKPDEIINGEITGNKEIGRINNYGVVGVSDIGSSGQFNNYGLIDVKNAGAITLLSTNQVVTNFDKAFDNGILVPANANKMGTVKLPSPTALVSVANVAANGFIAYNWTGTPYATPAGNVKFNTIVVSGDIEFTVAEPEIKYIIFNGTRTQVVNPVAGNLPNLKGVIVNAGKSIIIEKDNTLDPADGTYLGAGATVYKGGIFTHNAKVDAGTTDAHNYFGDWLTTQIVKY